MNCFFLNVIILAKFLSGAAAAALLQHARLTAFLSKHIKVLLNYF